MTGLLSTKHTTLAALAAVALLPTVIACGGSKDNTSAAAQYPNNTAGNCPQNAPPGYPGCPATGAPGQYPQQQQGAPQGGYPQQQGGYPTTQPTAAPTAQPTAAPTAQPTATPTGIPAIGGDAIDLAIRAVAQVKAPGMQPDGARFNGSVAAGGNTMTTVTLQAGKCYSVVVYPNPPIGGATSLKAELLAPLTQMVVETDTGTAPNGVVIGSGAKCISPIVPIPTPYTVRVTATAGTGGVAVQLFSKIK